MKTLIRLGNKQELHEEVGSFNEKATKIPLNIKIKQEIIYYHKLEVIQFRSALLSERIRVKKFAIQFE